MIYIYIYIGHAIDQFSRPFFHPAGAVQKLLKEGSLPSSDPQSLKEMGLFCKDDKNTYSDYDYDVILTTMLVIML